MQLHFFLRGEYRAIRRFKEEMSAIYLDFQYEKDDGKGLKIVINIINNILKEKL